MDAEVRKPPNAGWILTSWGHAEACDASPWWLVGGQVKDC